MLFSSLKMKPSPSLHMGKMFGKEPLPSLHNFHPRGSNAPHCFEHDKTGSTLGYRVRGSLNAGTWLLSLQSML